MKSKKRLIYAIAGTIVYAIGMNIFIVPLGLYSGGFMGIGQLIRTFFVSFLHLNVGSLDIAGILSISRFLSWLTENLVNPFSGAALYALLP